MSKISSKKKSKTKENQKSSINIFENIFKFIPQDKIAYLISGIYFFVLLILSLTYHKIGDYGVETDFYEGLVLEAKEFIKGNLIIEGYKGPLYPIVLGIISIIFKDIFTIGVILSSLSAAVFLFFSYKILNKVFNSEVAFYSVLLIATNSVFIQYSYSAGTDLFFCGLTAISLYLLFKDEKISNLNLFFAGIVASLGYLTRSNGLFLPIAFFVFLLIFYKKIGGIKTALIKYAIYFGGFIILNIPWSIYKFIQKGDFFYDQNFKNTAWALYGEGKVGWDYFNAVEAPKFNSMADVFFRDPIHFLTQILFVNFYKNFTGDLEKLVSLPFAILLVIGLIALFFRKYNLNQFLFFINLFFAFVLLLPAFYSERFSLFLLLGYSAFVILFITLDKIKNINGGIISLLLFSIVFIWSLSNSIKFNSNQIDAGPKVILEVADKFPNEMKKEDKLVIARKPQIGYYLNMNYRKIPYTQYYDSLIIWMREKDADYFFVSEMEAATLMSYTTNRTEQEKFYNLIDPNIPKNEFKVITSTIDPPTVLYQFIK